ncbi:MAG: hypothetical protein ACK4N5_08530, partial [Myxococcales bacterium]
MLRALPPLVVLLALALSGEAQALPRLTLRCDFCGTTPATQSPVLREQTTYSNYPTYPAPPELEDEPAVLPPPLPPVVVDTARIRLLEDRLRLIDVGLRENNQTVAVAPLLMGLGSAGALILGGPIALVGLILFAGGSETLTAALVMTTIGGALVGMSVLLGVLAYKSLADRRDETARLTAERTQVVEELRRLRGPGASLPTPGAV